MSATLKIAGCCPICNKTVPRYLTRQEGHVVEVYACPIHGTVGYGPQRVSLSGWVQHMVRAGSVSPEGEPVWAAP